MFTRILLPILAIVALLCFSGCTDDQLRTSAAAVEEAGVWQTRAERAHQVAVEAIAQVKILAEKLDSAQAADLIGRAESALAITAQGVETAGAAVEAAKHAQAAAQAAHDAGGGTWHTVLAALGGALGGAALLFPKLRGALLLGQQLVAGIQAVRKGKGEAAWKADIAPKLAESLDEAAKHQVDLMLAKLPKVAA